MVKNSFSKDMGVTHNDFFRLLPKAMGEHTYTVDGHAINAQVDDGSLLISLSEQKLRKIALLHIPFLTVNFEFDGVSEEHITAFIKHFDLYFQRGGG